MKKYISTMILLVALLAGMRAPVKASPSGTAEGATVKVENRQTATATVTQEMGVVSLDTGRQSLGGFLALNWGVLSLGLLSFVEVVTRLTPSQKDNTVLAFVSQLLNAIIPNLRKGGGRL